MAEGVLFNIAEGILGKLGSLALQEIGLLSGVKGELRKLENTVSTIRDVLLDTEEQYGKTHPSHQFKGWLGRLKVAVYEADDLLDEFCTEALQRQVMRGGKLSKEVRIFFSRSNQLAFRHNMAHKIKEIRENLDAIAKDRHQFDFVERPVETRVVCRPRDQTHSYVREEGVIGREMDKGEIIKLLLDSHFEENVSFISIFGIGGLGKTTLAQLAFNDEEVQARFDIKLWACISDDFDVKLIVEKILESATREKSQNLTMETLQNCFRETINGKKYLLVLDDIWNEDFNKWLDLRNLLMDGAMGSRVIVTTRSKKIAEFTSTGSSYELKGLPDTESWALFTQMAFKGV